MDNFPLASSGIKVLSPSSSLHQNLRNEKKFDARKKLSTFPAAQPSPPPPPMSSATVSGEECKVPALYDSSSSPSHPLLLPRPPGPPASPPAAADDYPEITYNHGPRPFRDLPFLLLFLLLSLSSLALGIFSLAHRNPHAARAASFSYNASAAVCQLRQTSAAEFELARLGKSQALSSSALIKDLVWTLVVTLLLAAPLALLWLWSLRHYTKQIVYASLPFFVIIPVFVNVFWFVACTVSSSCRDAFPLAYRILALAFVFLIIAILAWIIVANWHRIELTVWIIQIGAQALGDNLRLFVVLPLMGLGLLAYFVPTVVFLVFTPENGKVVPKLGSDGSYHCRWEQDSWVPAYFALAIITMIWSATTMTEAQAYVISGTIAQWYFAKESPPSRSIRSSIRNAFGPSFGTVCFSGMIIGAVRFVRASVDGARREDVSRGAVFLFLQCCANALLSSIDFLNKFTINFSAITGEAYCSSAKMTYELLRRNLLSAAFVEAISTRILVGITFILSAIYAIVACAILKAVAALKAEVYLVAVLVFLLLFSILGFFAYVLDNVIDTIYVCYAIDRDRGEVCKQRVHEIYVQLPLSRDNLHYHRHLRTSLLA